MNKTILLISENPDIRQFNHVILTHLGYQVVTAETLENGKESFYHEQSDLIVLDLDLPDGNGLEFCRSVRAESGVPIMLLSMRSESADIVRGFKSGGDDYLSKPYSPDVFGARVEALLRRGTRKPDRRLRYGPLMMDVLAARAFLDGADLMLSQKEFAILLLLLQQSGEVIPKETVYQKVWGYPMANDSQALYGAVYRLKKKLEQAGGKDNYLVTKRGEGYRFWLS